MEMFSLILMERLASYYWSRVAAAVGRLSQYLAGYSSTTWHMLVADDYLLECGGPGYRCGVAAVFRSLCLSGSVIDLV